MTRRNVLLVAPSPHLAVTLVAWLRDAGYEVILVTSFASAKALEHGPSLLISEVRLGDYNGLHLAIRARAHDIPAIVVGHSDRVLQRDAEQVGATYLTYELDRSQFLRAIELLPLGPETDTPTFSAMANLSFVSWKAVTPPPPLSSESLPVGRRPLPS